MLACAVTDTSAWPCSVVCVCLVGWIEALFSRSNYSSQIVGWDCASSTVVDDGCSSSRHGRRGWLELERRRCSEAERLQWSQPTAVGPSGQGGLALLDGSGRGLDDSLGPPWLGVRVQECAWLRFSASLAVPVLGAGCPGDRGGSPGPAGIDLFRVLEKTSGRPVEAKLEVPSMSVQSESAAFSAGLMD